MKTRKYLTQLFTSVTFCLVLTAAFGQIQKPKPNSFVIKGSIKNFNGPSWDFAATGFFDNSMNTIPVSGDGAFNKTFAIANPQDLYLYLNNDAITIFAVPGDTLTINWDNNDFNHTFKITANIGYRQKELDLMMELYSKYRQPLLEMQKDMYSQQTADSVKFNKIKGLFTAEVKTIAQYPVTANSGNVLCNTYFQYLNFFMRRPYKSGQNYNIPFPDSLKTRYGITFADGKTLDEPLFMNSNAYRDYIFYQVRMGSNLFNSYNFIGSPGMLSLNYTMLDCYKGAAYLDVIPTIRDWYLAKAIMEGFAVYPFNDVEQAYFKFLPEIKTKIYKDSLLSFYAGVQALKPGNPAPVFTLQDSDGKSVSLSDFRGKAIYLDFWGVGCGPCVYDIKNYSAKLHEKYKNKKVVFLNICVDANNAEWRKSLLDLHMEGINLIAEGWVKNPVCKTYHISSIPQYILIDAKGNIVDNNAGRMGELLGLTGMASAESNAAGNNEIDKTLNK